MDAKAGATQPKTEPLIEPPGKGASDGAGLPRRQVLAAGAVSALGLVALGGCGGGGAKSDSGSGGRTSSAPSSSPSASASAPAGATGAKPLARLADVPVGGAISATGTDGRPVIVAQPSAGQVVAFSAICTHKACTVAPAGKQLHCPCHGSVYDAATGKNLSGPAPRPLSPVPVHVAGGQVVGGA